MTKSTLTVRTQLLLAFGGMTVLMGLVTFVALQALTVENGRFVGFVNGIYARASLAAEIRSAVDRRAIAARNLTILTNPSEIEVERVEVLRAHQDVHTHLDKLLAMAKAPDVSPDARAVIAELDRVEAAYGPVALDIVDKALKGYRAEAARKIESECRPLLAALVKASKAYLDATTERGQTMVAEAQGAHTRKVAELGFLCALAMVAALALGTLIVRRLGQALGAEPAVLSEAARQVAGGNLAVIAGSEKALAGSVLASLAHMQKSLSSTVRAVRDSSDSIATGSTQIASGNADLSRRTEEQAASLQRTASTMAQLGDTVQSNSNDANRADTLAGEATQVARRGGQVVSEVVQTMGRINDGSKRIAEITGLIDSIAFQTNILALNAAVEAARAGEQGRGFAVVATEVRSLAQRSAEAAREIKDLIGSSVAHVTQGTELVDRAGSTMEEIVRAVQQVKQIVEGISKASAQQSDGVSQIGGAVGQIDRATQQNAALVEQSAAAAESLKEQAIALVSSVAAFKLAA